MVSRFRSGWQQIKKHWVATGVVGIALVVVISLIISVVWFNGTGFDGYNQVTTAHTLSGPSAGTVVRTEVYQPGKSLWDWLQLLIIPLVLAVGALLFNLATTRTEQKIAAQRYKQDQLIAAKRYENEQRIALDKQREGLLQIYLDRMSELLLKEKLRSSAVDAEVRNVARVRTITILFQLDARRIGYVFAFLREAGLMSNKPNSSIVSLSGADLSKINLSQANLSGASFDGASFDGANLGGANLSGADLSGANLSGANLDRANLSAANLSESYLFGANLSGADLSGAMLAGADLSAANLSKAKLSKSNLSAANLFVADLIEANLYKAILSGANLGKANLSRAMLAGADLSAASLDSADLSGAVLNKADLSAAVLFGARVTEEQLKKAKSLAGVTLPDGSKHA